MPNNKDRNNTNNGQNLINPTPNRNRDNTSSTSDAILEKVAENLNQVNSGLNDTVKAIKDGFKQMSSTDKKQNKELNTAIGKLTSTIAENTKSNNDKNKKANSNSSNKNDDSVEQRRQARQDRLISKQDKAYADFTNALAKLKEEIDSITDDTSEESKRLISNYEDLNKFFTEYDNSIDKVTGNLNEISLGADKFEKALRNINVSYGSSINKLTKDIWKYDNAIQSAKNNLAKSDREKVEQAKKDIVENERKKKNAEKLLALQTARVTAETKSAKLNKTIDDLRYDSELRKAEFEAKSAERSQKILDSFSDDVNSEFLKSVQSIQEYATKLEESYINTGEKGPLYNEISNTLNDMETALIKGDKESYKVNEAILKSLQQSRESIIGKGGDTTNLDLMVAYQNAENARKLALDIGSQQEIANRYIDTYKDTILSLQNSLTDLERQKIDYLVNNPGVSDNDLGLQKIVEQIEDTQNKLSNALVIGATITNSANKLASGDIKTRSETMLEDTKNEREAIENKKASNFKELDEILRLRSSSDLSNRDKKELDEREKFLKKQNSALDYVEDQITQMIGNIQKGNLKAASKNIKNIDMMKKHLDNMEKNRDSLIDSIKGSFDEIKDNFKPQGTISKLISKGLKYVANEVINYSTRIQTDALTSLQNSYKNQGMNIAKQNMFTRKDIQRMMGDIGNELVSQGIKGIDTTDVMDMAETLANNGVTDEKVLKDMSIAMSKAAAVNPELKAEFGDVNALRHYQKIYDEAVKLGESGAEALEKELDATGSALRGVKQANKNGYAFANGNLAELNSTMREFWDRMPNMTEENRNDMRKGTYALAGVVGKNGDEFTSWYQNMLEKSKNSLSGEFIDIIQGTTDGKDMIDAYNRHDMGTYLSDAYSKLLSYDYDKTTGKVINWDQGYELLMKQLGIDTDDLNKIRNNKDYAGEDGNFDINKFKEAYKEAYEAAGSNDYEEKKKENLEEGQMQTVEESLESKAINNLTEHFTNMVSTDIPYMVDEEIKAIDASANLLKDVIDSGIDLLVGVISGSGAANLLGSGLGGGVSKALGGTGGLLGKAGSVGAGLGVVGIAAGTFAAAYSVGTAIDKMTGWSDDLSDWMSGMDDAIKEYEKDEEQRKELLKAQKDTKDALTTLNTSIKQNTDALGEKATKTASSESYQATLKNAAGTARTTFNDDGTDKSNLSHTQKKSREILAKRLAGVAMQSKNPQDYFNDIAVDFLNDAGYNKEQIQVVQSEFKGELDKQLYYKKQYEEINKYGEDLKNIYDNMLKLEKDSKEGGKIKMTKEDAWNQAFDDYVKNKGWDSSNPIVRHHNLSKSEAGKNVYPKEGIDFKLEGNKFVLQYGLNLSSNRSADAGDLDIYNTEHLGKFATGLEEVPYDNYLALLHKGERVQTAAQVTQDRLQEELNDSLETLNTTLINSDNGIVETFDDTQIVNTIETQTNDMSNLINSVLEILNIIANNTKYNYNTTNSSGKINYIENAIANRSTRISDFKNPTMY